MDYGLLEQTLFFRNPHQKKSSDVKLSDLGRTKAHATNQSVGELLIKAISDHSDPAPRATSCMNYRQLVRTSCQAQCSMVIHQQFPEKGDNDFFRPKSGLDHDFRFVNFLQQENMHIDRIQVNIVVTVNMIIKLKYVWYWFMINVRQI